MVRDPVADGCHGVFPDAEMEIAIGFTTLLETGLSFDVGQIGVGEVGRAPDQLGQVGADGVEAFVGVLAVAAPCQPLCRRAGRHSSPGQFSPQLALELSRFLWIPAAVGGEGGVHSASAAAPRLIACRQWS